MSGSLAPLGGTPCCLAQGAQDDPLKEERRGLIKGHQKSKGGGLPASLPLDGAPVLRAAPLSQDCWILPCEVMVKGPTVHHGDRSASL